MPAKGGGISGQDEERGPSPKQPPSSWTPLMAGSGGPRSDCSDDSVADRMPPKQMHWLEAGFVMNAAVIGMGILTLPHAFKELGWVLGYCMLVFCFLFNVLCAFMMVEVQNVYPSAITCADATQCVLGSRTAKQCVRWVLYSERLFGLCAVMVVIGKSMGRFLSFIHLCQPQWIVVSIFAIVPFSGSGLLSETRILNLVNTTTITIAVLLISIHLLSSSTGDARGVSMGIPETTTVPEAFGAIAAMVFAFSGNWMYYEMMSEMEVTRDLPKAFVMTGPTQLGLYSLITAVGYGKLGLATPGEITDAVLFGHGLKVISFLLLVHFICGAITTNVVLVRFFQSRVCPRSVNDSTAFGAALRITIASCVMLVCFFVASVVPSFEFIISFIGALFEAPISFILPVVHFLLARRANPEALARAPVWWVPAGVGALVFGILIMVFGVANSFKQLTGSWEPFKCGCEGIWNTCACSSKVMPAGVCPTTMRP